MSDLRSASLMGWFVLCPNPRGSYGQGEAFTQGNVKSFGGGDYRDVMAGVNAMIKDFPIDAKKLGIRVSDAFAVQLSRPDGGVEVYTIAPTKAYERNSTACHGQFRPSSFVDV